jgi:peptidoglycan/xylan/chitin deacetylase (PgdA/CDA1 family)
MVEGESDQPLDDNHPTLYRAKNMSTDTYARLVRQAVPLPVDIIGKSRAAARSAMLYVHATVNKDIANEFLRCLYCHYVFDDQIEQFEKIISRLKEQGTFVTTDACVDMLKGEKQIDGKYFHLSFDDGFRNNFVNALPVLEKHNVPAIFFVPSSLINAELEETKHYCLETTNYSGIIETLKWRDLETMISLGYEVGSHTKTHARFSDISNDDVLLEDEIAGSKHVLESHLRYECKYISWPYGRVCDSDEASLQLAKSAGYEACFGAFRGTIYPGKTDIFRIPRHHFEAQWPVQHIEYFARGNLERTV